MGELATLTAVLGLATVTVPLDRLTTCPATGLLLSTIGPELRVKTVPPAKIARGLVRKTAMPPDELTVRTAVLNASPITIAWRC